jgi:hypothetical protein
MTTNFVGTPTEIERLELETLVYKAVAKAVSYGLRVGLPGIIQSFDATKQTVTVDLAITDKIKTGLPAMKGYNPDTGNFQIPTLLDVPIVLPRAGGKVLTMPITKGDECLVMFADMCINSWYQNGGIQNQERLRRHNFSDGFAILGPWSQPNVITDYSTTEAQLRTEDGTVSVAITDTDIKLTGPVELNGPVVVGSSYVNVSNSLPVKINGVVYYIKLSTSP